MRARLALIGISLLVLAAATRGAETQAELEYMAVFLDGKKIGWVEHTRKVADANVTTTDTMVLTLGRAGIKITIRQTETCTETADGKPLGFTSIQETGLMAQKVEGVVADGKVKVTITEGGETQRKTLDWPEGAVLAEGARLLALEKGLKEGTTYTVKSFSPEFLRVLETQTTVGSTKEVDLLGRVVKLTEVIAVAKAPTGELNITAYVDDKGDAKKMIVPLAGMKLELLACDRAFALSKDDVTDFVGKMVLPSPESLSDAAAAKSITYTLTPTDANAKLKIPTTDSQSVKADEGGALIVTVCPAPAAAGVGFPYKGDDKAAIAAMKPTRYAQSDSNEIVELARKAVADAQDAAEAVRRIEAFVAKYIRKKDLSVGYASAVEVARSRQGDCTEHAVLAAAICRAAGIPAQVVTGVAYVDRFGVHKEVFGPHAWVQAYVGGKWVGLDAALGGFDARHIALAVGDGDPTDFFGLINTLGCFKIGKVEVRK